MPTAERYAFGDYVLERTQQRVLRGDGADLGLTPRLFNALLLLVEHAGELLVKDALMQALWPGLVVEENNLNQVILGLRRALGDDGETFIQTLPRRGFRFVAGVSILPADAAAQEAAPSAPSAYREPAEPALDNGGGAGPRLGAGSRALLALRLPEPGAAAGPAEDEARARLRSLKQLIAEQLLPGAGGRVVRDDGGGLLFEFSEVRHAVRVAFAIRAACERANAGQPLPLSMGLQLNDDTAGLERAGLAASLCETAGAAGIVASLAVRNALTPGLDAEIEDLGECPLPGLSQPQRAYRLEPPRTRAEIEPGSAADALRATVAVIPFTEHGQGHEPLGEVLAEQVISALSQSPDLNVVSRLSTTAFRGRGATLDEVTAHLKASYVLSGAYRVARGEFLLTAELAETSTGRVAWARDLKGSVAGIIEGRDELIDRLVAEASGAIMARELERTQSQSLQTLETCSLLLGAITLMHRLSASDFLRARDMLQTVARRAPRHAVPQAWLAKWHVLRVWQGWSDDAAADTRLALDCGKRALDNDSQCSLALAIDGFVHTNLLKSLDVARDRYDLALQVNPNDALASLLSGTLHAFKGEGRQAVKATRRALRLSPLDLHRYFFDSLAASAELAAGHYERAIELARRSLRANRMHASTHRVLAIAQWQLERHQDARDTVAELMRIEPRLTVRQWLERSPSSAFPVGALCAAALRGAGVPP